MHTAISRNVLAYVALTVLLLLLGAPPVIAQVKSGDSPQKQKKSAYDQWKPTGKQILDFVESALKDPKTNRSQVEQVLNDLASGKAVFLMDEKATSADAGPCIKMACRSRPCATYLGGRRYNCNNCCIGANKNSSQFGSPQNGCKSEAQQSSALKLKDGAL
jgi:hypothetical protein